MPHQWIVSKALLDMDRQELSFRIASTGLELWKQETDETYNCYEHFMIANGRGAGFHQFSGLSSPVMKWFESYYIPGTITCGFQTKILKADWNETHTELTLDIEVFTEKASVIVCMNSAKKYLIPDAAKVTEGAYVFSLSSGVHTINIQSI